MQAASLERDTNPENILKFLQRKVGSQSTVPRWNPSSQSRLMKLGRCGPEPVARLAGCPPSHNRGNLVDSLHMQPAQVGIQILGKNTDDF